MSKEPKSMKDYYDKLLEVARSGGQVAVLLNKVVKLPAFEKTKVVDKKQDFLAKVTRGDFARAGKKTLNVIQMYNSIDQVKQYRSRMEKIDPMNGNLLQHKLSRAIDNAAFIWGGKPVMNDRSQQESLRDMNSLLAQSKLQAQSQPSLKTRYIYTNSHVKVRLEHGQL